MSGNKKLNGEVKKTVGKSMIPRGSTALNQGANADGDAAAADGGGGGGGGWSDANVNSAETTAADDKRESKSSSSLAKGAAANKSQLPSLGYNMGHGNQKRVLENQFNTKKKRYITIKRDIDDKKKSWFAVFEELLQLRDKILACGAKDPGKLEDLLPPPLPWNPSATGGRSESNELEVARARAQDEQLPPHARSNDQLTGQLKAIASNVTEAALAFCNEVLDKRAEIYFWLANMKSPSQDALSFAEEISNQLEVYQTDSNAYGEQLERIRAEQQVKLSELLGQLEALLAEQASLRKERDDYKYRAQASAEEIEQLTRELRQEKEKGLKLRGRLREQEASASKSEEKLEKTKEQLRQLELQLQERQNSMKNKVKELSKLEKSRELALGRVDKQKEAVEQRLAKLKEDFEFKETEAKTIISEYKKQVEQLEAQIATEKTSRQEIDKNFDELKKRYNQLEDKCKQLLDSNDIRLDERQHSDYEIQLFNELKEVQRSLIEKDQLIEKLQNERQEIISSVKEVHDEKSGGDSSKERLTAELLKRSNELHSVSGQFHQLQKNYKRAQTRVEQLEKRLAELGRLQSKLKDSSNNKAQYEAQLMQLQQQLSDACVERAELEARNQELERQCTQLQMQLEHQKRHLRDLKVRRELQQLLHPSGASESAAAVLGGNSSHNFHHQINASQINHQDSCEQIEQLRATLETKELQVAKLEKLVKQLEKHEEFSQAQRTRLEARIAKLELALKQGQQQHRSVLLSSSIFFMANLYFIVLA
ncbi:paramyosin-like [Trichogramma pretiosum]|uniref:paramyosin-like n=1 Tax=Trichogramma pretiosum TaxID=7493 RepID=UPI000C7193D5|nr:paramyosin-like [Trichogramma pretiosum]